LVHVEVGGLGTHEARSQIMYSMIRSCELSAVWSHSLGNAFPFDCVALLTWKSLKMPCPHWPDACAIGMSNVK
jgi:hypothetical protein